MRGLKRTDDTVERISGGSELLDGLQSAGRRITTVVLTVALAPVDDLAVPGRQLPDGLLQMLHRAGQAPLRRYESIGFVTVPVE